MTAAPVTTIRSASAAFSDVRRVFGANTALDGLTLPIEPGELLALLGPSGCGKTTALRLLAGFDRPTSGSVLVDGKDVSGVPASKRDIGMVFQSYSLFPTMSAIDNVAFGLRTRGQSTPIRRGRAGELLELVGLSVHADKYPHQLSGGQQQRVALARALAIAPRLLLLDEPLSALDAKVREQLREEIRRIQVELGVTTVLVTHDQEEALSMADRVAVMNEGRLEQCAAPDELYARPSTVFVAEFVGTMNRVPAVTEAGGRVHVFGRSVAANGEHRPAGQQVTVLVRPESLVVSQAPSGWTVSATTFRGATSRLRLSAPGEADLLADISAHRSGDFLVGSTASVALSDQPVLIAS
jgi:putative spermidine/putrescine transport system ATP-binding protein